MVAGNRYTWQLKLLAWDPPRGRKLQQSTSAVSQMLAWQYLCYWPFWITKRITWNYVQPNWRHLEPANAKICFQKVDTQPLAEFWTEKNKKWWPVTGTPDSSKPKTKCDDSASLCWQVFCANPGRPRARNFLIGCPDLYICGLSRETRHEAINYSNRFQKCHKCSLGNIYVTDNCELQNELNETMCNQTDDTSSQLMQKYVSKQMTLSRLSFTKVASDFER